MNSTEQCRDTLPGMGDALIDSILSPTVAGQAAAIADVAFNN